MNATLYLICQILVTCIVLGLVTALAMGFRYALRRLHLPERRRKLYLLFTTLGLICWLAILAVLASEDFFRDFRALPPRILVAILPPVVLIVVLLFSRFFKLILEVIPESWLLYIQSFRVFMELALWLGFLGGFVPFQMTFEGFNQDIIVGITAGMAGFVFFGRGRYRRLEAFIWNIFGIALLSNIVTIAFLSTPSPFRVFTNEPANTFVANVPFIWIPGFIVPFALAMHLFSLRQLFLPKRKTVSHLLGTNRLFRK